jgi:hypothetical protein
MGVGICVIPFAGRMAGTRQNLIRLGHELLHPIPGDALIV